MSATSIGSQRHKLTSVVLLVAAILLAYDSWNRARQAYMRVVDPAAAYERSPTDMRALQRAVNDELTAGKVRRLTDRDAANARSALLRSPINSAALRAIAMYAQQSGHNVKAATAFYLSDMMTRRDSVVQLWLIEYAVSRENVAEAIKHYDAALAVKPDLSDTLFPILTRAMTFPAIRMALRPYILRDAPWAGSLLTYAIAQGDPRNVLTLLSPIAPKLSGDSFEDVSRALANRLVDFGYFPAAERVLGWKRPLAAKAINSFAVTPQSLDPRIGIFAWRLPDENGLTTSPNTNNGFDITAQPLATGIAATRTLPVMGGRRYNFQQSLTVSSSSAGTYRWQGICISNQQKRQIWDQQVNPTDRLHQWSIVIPRDCVGTQFNLLVDGPDGQLPSTASISNLAFRPAEVDGP